MYYNNMNNRTGMGNQTGTMGNNVYGMNNQQPRYINGINSVEDVLYTLSQLIMNNDRGTIHSSEIKNVVNQLQSQNALQIVGEGTNRIVVSVNGNIGHYIGDTTKQYVIKIPFTTSKGLVDNISEYLVYRYLSDVYAQNRDADLGWLVSVMPEVRLVTGYPGLIAQEMVIPIERSTYLANTPEQDIPFKSSMVILNKFGDQHRRLIRTLDKWCAFADLNPLVTPKQYGFKRMNNVGDANVLTILDTGYCIPRLDGSIYTNGAFTPTGMPLVDRRYLIMGSDIIVEDDGMQRIKLVSNNDAINPQVLHTLSIQLKSGGLTIKRNAVGASNNASTLMESDMVTFKSIFDSYRKMAMLIPNSAPAEYFGKMLAIRNGLQ